MKDKLVTVATFGNIIDAQLALGKLENAGIVAVLFDENIGNILNVLVGGIKLKTREEDQEEAKKIISGEDESS
jgi:hypothetical protein